jgi:hypothetical protein
VINAVTYSELFLAFERIEELEAVLSEASIPFEAIPREALFLAGKAIRIRAVRSDSTALDAKAPRIIDSILNYAKYDCRGHVEMWSSGYGISGILVYIEGTIVPSEFRFLPRAIPSR